ncbi:hypothetical protein [Vibrio sp.]|uniref:hypothetical protein n=1 Tax=Vibrio sp. TaxID=678 RepID=UPI003F6D40D5
MMNSGFKQRGVGIVEFLITLGLSTALIIVVLPMYLDYRADEKARAYGEHIRVLIERIHQYQYYKVTEEGLDPASEETWPATLDNLMTDYPEQYWGSCTIDQELNGECKLPDYIPWSHSRLLTDHDRELILHTFNDHLILQFPLSELKGDPKEWTRWSSVLMDIPGAKRVGQDIEITLRQATLALMYDNIVMRDGNATLKGDWDIGGEYGITNAKDYTIAASDGSQISVSKRLVTIEGVSHGDTVRKPKCSKGLSPQLTLSLSEIPTLRDYDYLISFKSYIESQNSNFWTIGIDSTMRNANTNKHEMTHHGKSTALVQCI